MGLREIRESKGWKNTLVSSVLFAYSSLVSFVYSIFSTRFECGFSSSPLVSSVVLDDYSAGSKNIEAAMGTISTLDSLLQGATAKPEVKYTRFESKRCQNYTRFE